MVKISYRLSYHTAYLTICYVISYSYELLKITSIQCTFVVSNVVSTLRIPAHSSCLTHHYELFVWLLHTDLHTIHIQLKTYVQYCPLNVYLTNDEPGTTRHILYNKILFWLLFIHVIFKLGVY